jgi:aromatic-L-amino-acid decarboxylase
VIRCYGVEGLQEKIREHINIAERLAEMISAEPDFELSAPVVASVVCFRYKPAGYDEAALNRLNEKLNHALNETGKIYLTHTTLNGSYTLRMVTAQTNVTFNHVCEAWKLIMRMGRSINE